jgi:uncharacterized membrane protein
MLRTILAAGAILALLATAARADDGFRVCNRTEQTLMFAKALNVTSREDRDKGIALRITSEGWYELAPGQCRIAYPGKLQYRYYLVYAIVKNSLREWTGEVPVCVQSGDFTITGDRCAAGPDRRMFIQVDNGDEENAFTYDFK